jgi:hypothetical protein
MVRVLRHAARGKGEQARDDEQERANKDRAGE